MQEAKRPQSIYTRWFGNGKIDWILFFATLPLLGAGLVTMYSFVGENYFFNRQLIWIALSLIVFFAFSFVDFRFLRRGGILLSLFVLVVSPLILLVFFGEAVRGAQSWLTVGGVYLQPADFMKILLILILAKYFSRRHIEIAHIRHILISGIYAFIPFVLIFLQPDFGSAVIIFVLWLGVIVVSGVSKKHLLFVFGVAIVSFTLIWTFGFTENQKARIVTFIHPLADIQGAGYNAFQSTIAVGSGELFGRGIGYGTQSRLAFLPEYQTDFIFAAFAEEWGFVGSLLLFALFGVVIWRIVANAYLGSTNFETLFGLGLAILFLSQIVVHVGMNIGLLPVTGLTLPLVSYGGSHLLTEFMGLGILMGMRRYKAVTHKSNVTKEFHGL